MGGARRQFAFSANPTIDFEDKPSYSITLNVTDDGVGGAIDDSLTITISVTDIDEAGSVSLSGAAQVGETLQMQLTDPDNGTTTDPNKTPSWQWYQSSTPHGTFEPIDSANASMITIDTGHLGKYLRATATYDDIHSPPVKTISITTGQVGTLVSNVRADPYESTFFWVARAFTTGSNPNGYLVTGIGAAVGDNDFNANDKRQQVQLYTSQLVGDPPDADARPHQLLAEMNTPETVTPDAVVEFVAPETIKLRPDTTYFITLGSRDTIFNVTWTTTRSLTHLDAGQWPRWSMSEESLYELNDAWVPTSSQSALVHVTGTVRTDPASTQPMFSSAAETLTVDEGTTAQDGVIETVEATDTDGDELTYSIVANSDIADGPQRMTEFQNVFELNPDTGEITIKEGVEIDYEEGPTEYSVTLQVTDGTDGDGYTELEGQETIDATVTLNIDVANINETGSLEIDGEVEIGSRLTATLTDPDGSVSVSQWQWARADAAAGPFSNISDATAVTYTVTQDDVSKFLQLSVDYTDGTGESSQLTAAVQTQVGLSVLVSNIEETLGEAGTDHISAQPFMTGSHDGDYDLLSVSILYESGDLPKVSIFGANGDDPADLPLAELSTSSPIPQDSKVEFSADSPVRLTKETKYFVVISDPDGDSGARHKYTTSTREDVAADGWTIGDGRRYKNAAIDTSWTSNVTAVKIEIKGYALPVIPTEPYFVREMVEWDVAENSPAGTIVGTPEFIVPDASDTLTFMSSGLGAPSFDDLFIVNSATGVVTVKSGAEINFETGSSYIVDLTVSNREDDSDTAENPVLTDDTLPVMINVTNVDESINGIVEITVFTGLDVDTRLYGIGPSGDPDGSPLTDKSWQWSRSGTLAGPYTDIEDATSAFYTVKEADDGKFLRFTATYLDPQSDVVYKTAYATTARVGGELETNTEPRFSSTTESLTVSENATSGTLGSTFLATDDSGSGTDSDGHDLTYSISGTDVAYFSTGTGGNTDFAWYPTTGEIVVNPNATIDYETKNTYSIVLNVSDGKNADLEDDTSIDDTLTLTITVTDVDEAGQVTLSTPTPIEGTAITASLSDPDVPTSSVAWKWQSSATINSVFTDIMDAESDTYTPAAGDADDYLRATVSYTDKHGVNKTGQATTTSGVQALVTNAQPTFADAAETLSIDENSSPGVVLTPTAAVDTDTGDQLTYRITGTSAQVAAFEQDFDFDDSTAQISVKASATIDFEERPSYSVTLEVSDSKNGSGATDTAFDDTLTLTIDVGNVEEPGTLGFDMLQPQVGTSLRALIEDPDGSISGESWEWAWSSTKNGTFENVTSNGTAASYTPTIEDADRYLRVSVTYTDGEGSGKMLSGTVPHPVGSSPHSEAALVRNLSQAGGAVTETGEAQGDNALLDSSTAATPPALAQQFTTGSNSGGYWLRSVQLGLAADVGAALEVQILRDASGVPDSTTPMPGLTPAGSFDALVTTREEFTHTGILLEASTSYWLVVRATGGGFRLGSTSSDGEDNGRAPGWAIANTAYWGDPNAATMWVADTRSRAVRMAIGGDAIDAIAAPDQPKTLSAAGGDAQVTLMWMPPDNDGGSPVTKYSYRHQPAGRQWSAWTDVTDSDADNSLDDERMAVVSGLTNGVLHIFEVAAHNRAGRGAVNGTNSMPLAPNTAPLFELEPVDLTVSESARENDLVGTVAATDDDAGDTLSYSVTGTDAAGFHANFVLDDSTGQIAVKSGARLDHESKPTFELTMNVHDGKNAMGAPWTVIDGTEIDATKDFTIDVTNEDEPGTVTITGDTEVVSTLTAEVQDPDGGISGETWKWQSSTSSTSGFTDITSAIAATYTVTVSDLGRYLRAVVTYTDDHGPGKTQFQTTADTVATVVTNSAPRFTNSVEELTVDENMTGDDWTKLVAATDPQSDVLNYSVDSADAAELTAFNKDFSLDPLSGQISARSTATIDFEKRASYAVTLRATDSLDNEGQPDTSIDAEVLLTIVVRNLDEDGSLVIPDSPSVNSPYRASLTDPDGGVTSVTWTWWRSKVDPPAVDPPQDSEWELVTASGTLGHTYTPVADDAGYYLRVRVTEYTDLHGTKSVPLKAISSEKVTEDVKIRPVVRRIVTVTGTGGGGGGGDTEPSTAVVIVANGWRPADIGVAAALSARTPESAVIYTDGSRLSTAARSLLRDYLPAEVVVVGGDAAVSATALAEIRRVSESESVRRLSGATRVDTAAAVARRALAGSSSARVAIIANGWSPADIGVAAALSARTPGSAVLYVTSSSLPDATESLLSDRRPSRVVIVGGTSAVGSEVEAAIRGVVPAADVERISGTTRADTAANVARSILVTRTDVSDEGTTLIIANGWGAPDVGIAAAVSARTSRSAVLYSTAQSLTIPTAQIITAYQPFRVVLIGGNAVISADLERAIRELAPGSRVVRYSGSSRTQTAAAAARRVLGNP